MRLLIALGGNALVLKGQSGQIYEQFQNIDNALDDIVKLISEGHELIITHGNGFQVGNVILRSELAREFAYEIPLYVADAHTQGEIGLIIQQTLQNKLSSLEINRDVVTVLTQVLVDSRDFAFLRPTKPIGRYYTLEEMRLRRKNGEVWIEDSNRGYRKLVPSPRPIDIVEKEIIKTLFESKVIVIACGGGGIPVINENGLLKGVDAVVDKDLASSLLAQHLKVDKFVILTGVKQVALNFGRKNQVWLEKITIKQAHDYINQGHFPEGSMAPKIRASIAFLKSCSKSEVIITSLDNLYLAFKGKGGTHICIC